MVSRSFVNTENLRSVNRELSGVRNVITGSILPVLGLSAAFSIMGGGLNDATSSGRAASSAMYQLRTSTYALQEAITRSLLPVIESLTPVLAKAADFMADLDEATGGWSTRLGLAAGAAFLLRGRLIGLGRIALGAAGIGAAGAAAGGAGVAARAAPVVAAAGGAAVAAAPVVAAAVPLVIAGATIGLAAHAVATGDPSTFIAAHDAVRRSSVGSVLARPGELLSNFLFGAEPGSGLSSGGCTPGAGCTPGGPGVNPSAAGVVAQRSSAGGQHHHLHHHQR